MLSFAFPDPDIFPNTLARKISQDIYKCYMEGVPTDAAVYAEKANVYADKAKEYAKNGNKYAKYAKECAKKAKECAKKAKECAKKAKECAKKVKHLEGLAEKLSGLLNDPLGWWTLREWLGFQGMGRATEHEVKGYFRDDLLRIYLLLAEFSQVHGGRQRTFHYFHKAAAVFRPDLALLEKLRAALRRLDLESLAGDLRELQESLELHTERVVANLELEGLLKRVQKAAWHFHEYDHEEFSKGSIHWELRQSRHFIYETLILPQNAHHHESKERLRELFKAVSEVLSTLKKIREDLYNNKRNKLSPLAAKLKIDPSNPRTCTVMEHIWKIIDKLDLALIALEELKKQLDGRKNDGFIEEEISPSLKAQLWLSHAEAVLRYGRISSSARMWKTLGHYLADFGNGLSIEARISYFARLCLGLGDYFYKIGEQNGYLDSHEMVLDLFDEGRDHKEPEESRRSVPPLLMDLEGLRQKLVNDRDKLSEWQCDHFRLRALLALNRTDHFSRRITRSADRLAQALLILDKHFRYAVETGGDHAKAPESDEYFKLAIRFRFYENTSDDQGTEELRLSDLVGCFFSPDELLALWGRPDTNDRHRRLWVALWMISHFKERYINDVVPYLDNEEAKAGQWKELLESCREFLKGLRDPQFNDIPRHLEEWLQAESRNIIEPRQKVYYDLNISRLISVVELLRCQQNGRNGLECSPGEYSKEIVARSEAVEKKRKVVLEMKEFILDKEKKVEGSGVSLKKYEDEGLLGRLNDQLDAIEYLCNLVYEMDHSHFDLEYFRHHRIKLSLDMSKKNEREQNEIINILALFFQSQGRSDAFKCLKWRFDDKISSSRLCYYLALRLYMESGNFTAQAAVMRYLGRDSFDDNSPDLAQRHFEAAREISAARDDPAGESSALKDIGAVYAARGHIVEARHCYDQAQRLAAKCADRLNEGRLLLSAAELETEALRMEKRRPAQRSRRDLRAVELAERIFISESQSPRWAVESWLTKADVMASRGEASEARKYYARSVKVAGGLRRQDREFAALAQMRLACLDWRDKDAARALSCLQKAIIEFHILQDNHGLARARSLVAEIHLYLIRRIFELGKSGLPANKKYLYLELKTAIRRIEDFFTPGALPTHCFDEDYIETYKHLRDLFSESEVKVPQYFFQACERGKLTLADLDAWVAYKPGLLGEEKSLKLYLEILKLFKLCQPYMFYHAHLPDKAKFLTPDAPYILNQNLVDYLSYEQKDDRSSLRNRIKFFLHFPAALIFDAAQNRDYSGLVKVLQNFDDLKLMPENALASALNEHYLLDRRSQGRHSLYMMKYHRFLASVHQAAVYQAAVYQEASDQKNDPIWEEVINKAVHHSTEAAKNRERAGNLLMKGAYAAQFTAGNG